MKYDPTVDEIVGFFILIEILMVKCFVTDFGLLLTKISAKT